MLVAVLLVIGRLFILRGSTHSGVNILLEVGIGKLIELVLEEYGIERSWC